MSNNLLESLWARVDTNIGSRITKISELLTQSLSANDESKAARDAAAASATEAKNHADRAELATDVSGLRDEVTQQIAAVVDGSPAALDTIREVAEYAQANRGITDQLNAAIGDKANKSHTHTTADITNFATELGKKANTSHTHTTSQVTGLDAALDGKADKSYVDARPAIFAVPDINSASTDNLIPGDVVVDTTTWIFYYLK